MRQHVLLATALLLAVACSDDEPTGPSNGITAAMRADIAQSSGEQVAGDVAAMSHTEASSSSTLFTFAGNLDAGCTLSLGSLICVRSFGDIDGEARLTFRDQAGDDQTGYDASTTASAEINLESSGTVTRSGVNIAFDHEAEFDVTGLAGDETTRTWTGTGTTTVSAATFNGDRDYEFSFATSFANVVVAASGADPRWPASGSATTTAAATVTGGPDDGRTATVTVTVTFNGTASVPLKVGNANYTLNLETHAVTSVD